MPAVRAEWRGLRYPWPAQTVRQMHAAISSQRNGCSCNMRAASSTRATTSDSATLHERPWCLALRCPATGPQGRLAMRQRPDALHLRRLQRPHPADICAHLIAEFANVNQQRHRRTDTSPTLTA